MNLKTIYKMEFMIFVITGGLAMLALLYIAVKLSDWLDKNY